jgi:hypothetical protein
VRQDSFGITMIIHLIYLVPEQDKIIQVSGFGVKNTMSTQCEYLLVALTESGKVLLSTGDRIWCDVSAVPPEGEQK